MDEMTDSVLSGETYRVEVDGRFAGDRLVGCTEAVWTAWTALRDLELCGAPAGTEVRIVEDRTDEPRALWVRSGAHWRAETAAGWLC